jgi:hypothetical protein
MFSTFRNTTVSLGAAALALAVRFAAPAQAAYVVTLLEVQAGGGITNVVATGSGAIDLTDLSFLTTTSVDAFMNPSIAAIDTGLASSLDGYHGISGPTSFGSGNQTNATSGSGDIVGLFNGIVGGSAAANLIVPSGYVSGATLSDTATYDNATFSSLGVIPGTYTWHWGTGPDADSFTLQIGPLATTPEPASLPMLAIGLVGLSMVLRIRRAAQNRPAERAGDPSYTNPAIGSPSQLPLLATTRARVKELRSKSEPSRLMSMSVRCIPSA